MGIAPGEDDQPNCRERHQREQGIGQQDAIRDGKYLRATFHEDGAAAAENNAWRMPSLVLSFWNAASQNRKRCAACVDVVRP
jgi:predicted NAD/FAD-binding protein